MDPGRESKFGAAAPAGPVPASRVNDDNSMPGREAGMETNDEAARATLLLDRADGTTTSRVLALIDRLGIWGAIALASCVLSILSVSIASVVHRITGDPIGWTGLFNTAVIPFLLGVPTLIVLLSLLRQLAVTRRQLTRLSMLDPLTNALNRRSLLAYAERMLESSGDQPLSVALIDADWFKRINDRHGHIIGDECLRGITEAIHGRLPQRAVCGRFGGEEFAVVLPGFTEQAAAELAEEIRGDVAHSCREVDGKPVAVTISIGVAGSDCQIKNLDELLSLADQALYQAKDEGRDRVVQATFLIRSPAASPPRGSGFPAGS